MHVKKGDKVKIITGKHRGEEGVITLALPRKNQVIIKDKNIVKKHIKPDQTRPNGGVIEKEMPIHVSNVKLIKRGE